MEVWEIQVSLLNFIEKRRRVYRSVGFHETAVGCWENSIEGDLDTIKVGVAEWQRAITKRKLGNKASMDIGTIDHISHSVDGDATLARQDLTLPPGRNKDRNTMQSPAGVVPVDYTGGGRRQLPGGCFVKRLPCHDPCAW